MTNGTSAATGNKPFLKPEELETFLSVSRPTVYRLIERKLFPFYKIGGSLRFNMEDITEYIEENRIVPLTTNYEYKKKGEEMVGRL